jgi:hypothetical protein
VAVCGITDIDSSCDPADAGWFLSEFFALNYLLKNSCAAQTWVAAHSPEYLVEKYKEYLHGNPYKDRRVVLDKELLQSDQLSKITVVPGDEMVKHFIDILAKENAAAIKHNQALVIIILAHGCSDTFYLWLGHSADYVGGMTVVEEG